MSFSNFTREISKRIHQIEGTLKWPRLKLLLKIFHLWEILTWAGCLWESGGKKQIFVFFHHLSFLIPKVVRFLTLPPFECTFEPSPSSIASLIPRQSFWMRLRALIFFRVHLQALDHPFECAFEPSFSFECAFEPSPPSSAPLSPRPSFWVHLRALIFFRVCLRALTSFFNVPSSVHLLFSAPSSPHLLFKRTFEPSPSFKCAFEPSSPF